jgi:DNA polymerase elongation subunit (family B)
MFPREIPVDAGKLDNLQFQIVSWYTCDHDYSDDEDESDEEVGEASKAGKATGGGSFEVGKYLAKVFGVTATGESVSLNLLNYTPYFFIKIHHRLDRMFIERLREFVVTKLPFNLKQSLLNVKYMKKKDFWGFYNNEEFSFIRFTFKNLRGFRSGIRIMQNEVSVPGYKRCRYQLYESNIDPFLRLVHIRDIEPAGWVSVVGFEKNVDILPTKCQIDINVDWRKITRAHIEKMAPMVVASFDIECVSSHGDFPVGRKDYKKVAYEFFQLYTSKKDTIDEIKEYMFLQLMGIFDPEFQGEMSKVFLKQKLSGESLAKIRSRVNIMLDDIINVAAGKIIYKSGNGSSGSGEYSGKTTGPTKDEIMRKLTQVFGYYEELEDERTRKKTVTWKGLFPQIEGDEIIQIGTTVHNYGEKECNYKHIITLGSCEPIDGVVVESCDTERELLLKWCQLIDRLDPDILTGYNIVGFDMSYMYDRAIEVGIKTQFCKIGRIMDHVSTFQEKILSSSALGDNILKFLDMEGRVMIDIMKVVQRDHKLDSYKLDAVATHFMGMNKHDVSPNDIFRLQRGTAADRKIVADYCVQDCALCNHLMMKLEIIANNIGMANVCNVPLAFIFMRGQGIKIFSLVSKQCKQDDFLIPTLNKGRVGEFAEDAPEDEEGYEGAIVLEPKTGIYTEDPVSVLDYASLYPSSMISENLSHDCLVERGGKYDNLPGVEYLDVCYDIYEKTNDKKIKVGEKICRFTQNEKGVIPRILMKLIQQRKETRKKIEYQTVTTIHGDKLVGLYSECADDTVVLKTIDGKVSSCLKAEVLSKEDTYDDFTKAVLDGLQVAYKVTANSLYGQIGAKTSPIYLKDIAACTTATGRNMILKAKSFLEDNYMGVNIVYGDSVTGDTPLLVKFPDGHIDIITIETLTTDWIPYENFKPFDEGRFNKEQSFTDAKIWTDKGWAEIRRVIRHKTNKKLFRVNTFQGCVDVTEDHSLTGKDLNKIKPGECVIGETEILHSFPDEFGEFEFQVPAMSHGSKNSETFAGEYECTKCKEKYGADMFYKGTSGNLSLICKLCVKKRACERMGKVFNNSVAEKILTYNVGAYTITKEEAWVWGLFFADGSCGYYPDCPSGAKSSWGINKANMKVLDQAKKYLERFEPSFMKFHMLDTMESSSTYKLVPQGSLKYMASKYRPLFYDKDDYKKVPAIILNAPYEIRQWFFMGYQTGDGSKGHMAKGEVCFCCKGKIGAQGLYYIMKSIGYKNVRVNIREAKENTYWISTLKRQDYFDENEYKVMKMHEIGDTEHFDNVYDIETEIGRFHGGVGSPILFNTDSIFCAFTMEHTDEHGVMRKRTGPEAVQHAINMGVEASSKFKKYLKAPHDLEYEKTFFPFVLISKKRYCALKYEFDPHKCKFNSMGIALKRRDNAPIVKHVYGGVIDIIMHKQDVGESISFLKNSIQDLIDGKYPLEDLIISKSLRADYKDPTRIAHKALADRMGERDPGNKPQVNDRIPYVYVDISEKEKKAKAAREKILQGDRIEHPEYIRRMGLKPDYEFYITNQIMKPVSQIYALVLENMPGFKKGPHYFKEVEKKLIKEKEGDMKKVKDRLGDMREGEVQDILFKPFLNKLENKRSGNREITDWFKRLNLE